MTLQESLQQAINDTNLTLVKWLTVNQVKRSQVVKEEIKSVLYNFLDKALRKQGYNYIDTKYLKRNINFTYQDNGSFLYVDNVFVTHDESYWSGRFNEVGKILSKEIDFYQFYSTPKFQEFMDQGSTKLDVDFNPKFHLDLTKISNITF